MSRRRRSKPVSPVHEADQRLAVEQFAGLNRAFYEGFRSDAFRVRLLSLCLAHDGHDRLGPLLSEGVTWGKLTMASQVEGKDFIEYAELEILALHHHLSETVTRLFWVHANNEPCPWLALARIRQPSQLKDIAARYLEGQPWADTSQRRNGHALAMYGCPDLEHADDERLGPAVDCAIEWLELAARTVGAAPMYNAYKHGLAILPSAAFEMSFRPPAGDSLTMKGGRGYQYLEPVRQDNPPRRWQWQRTQEHVDFDARAAECSILLLVLDSILGTGALARGAAASASHRLLPLEASPAMCESEIEGPYFIPRFSEGLLYYRDAAQR